MRFFRFLRVLLGALLLFALTLFAVANRQVVTLSLEPLPFTAEMPLYLLAFLCLFFGLAIGALLQWLGGAATKARPEAKPAGGLPTVKE